MSDKDPSESIIDHLSAVAIWIVSEPGKFEYISAGFEDIWGRPSESLQNDPSLLFETIHPDDRERVRVRVAESYEGLSEDSFEARIVQPDGSVRWGHTRMFPLSGGDDTPVLVGITSDVTDLKHREQELSALNRLLRHDIRNDITIILGWASHLEDYIDEAATEDLQRILSAGEHVVELTETARDYAKAIADGEELQTRPVALRPLLQTQVDLRQEAFPHAEFSILGEIPNVEIRANELVASVFTNLLNNAVQHNDKEKPVVQISSTLHDGDVTVRIADNGPGLTDEEKELVFQKGRTGIQSSGLGVGLYLVQTLVNQHQGTVRVEDNTPTGSVFIVTLPCAAQVARAETLRDSDEE